MFEFVFLKMDDPSENLAKKLIDNLQSDLRSLITEAKKKYPQIKELCEAASIKLRTINVNQNSSAVLEGLTQIVGDVLRPLSASMHSKQHRLVQISLTAVQRLASHKVFDAASATSIVNELWTLMESEVEELRLLQTAALLVTSGRLIQGAVLSKCLVVCFRLNFAKDPFVINTASATVRQLVAQVFERLQNETRPAPSNASEIKSPVKVPPKTLSAAGADAFMLFQDLCRLVSAEQPFWLMGIVEMTRTLGLDLLEMILAQNVQLFTRSPEFVFLLKELVCPLVIKLFSPNLKYYQNQQRQQLSGGASSASGADSSTAVDKPYFPIAMRLMRLVNVLISKYVDVLSTECEIFLSLLVKFLENDKLEWQRALAIEIVHRIVSQRRLLWSFCQNYDMKPHSSKVLKDLASSLENFIQITFAYTHDKSPSSSVADSENGEFFNSPGFVCRGYYVPFINPASASVTKFSYMEMLEKVEPPSPPEGYLISLAFTSTTEIVQSVQLLVDECDVKTQKSVCDQLIASTQNSLISSLSSLLDASVDENLTETTLKALTSFLRLVCKLQLKSVRDAYLATLCKASLPPSYFAMIIPGGIDSKSNNPLEVYANNSIRSAPSNVVAVSTPCPVVGCPTASLQTQVMLTAKNLQAVRALIAAAQLNGADLQQSWHLVLLTLQHLVWLLNLRPTLSSGGGLKPSPPTEGGSGAGSILTTAVMADVPVLTNMLTRIFETTSTLDIVALHHVLNALCALSSDSMQIASDGREPSFFPVAKLMETTLFNLHRCEEFFKPVSSHFVELCFQPYPKLREWGAFALSTVVKSAFSVDHESNELKNTECQRLLFAPLSNLNENLFEDVRQQQIECALHVLRLKSQSLASNLWPSIIDLIGNVTKNSPSDALIRQAFQAVQLLTADILPSLPSTCLLSLIEIVFKFGNQTKDLNISLSAVGILWNLSDYLFRNNVKFADNVDEVSSDTIWLALFGYLAKLCVDRRPAVRKSACQTLFGTVGGHGNALTSKSWSPVLWDVLFPLLNKVKTNCFTASTEKVDLSSSSGGTNILIHHSRDTESKQWAETTVLTLAGVCRVFASKRNTLSSFDDYPRAWSSLLEFVEILATCNIEEISIAALRNFHDLLTNKTESPEVVKADRSPTVSAAPSAVSSLNVIINQPGKTSSKNSPLEKPAMPQILFQLDPSLLVVAWRVWLHIATLSTDVSHIRKEKKNPPSPAYLTSLLRVFSVLFLNFKKVVEPKDLSRVLFVLKAVVALPSTTSDSSIYLLPPVSEISPTQEAVLNCINLIYQESISSNSPLRPVLPELFATVLTFVGFCCHLPTPVSSQEEVDAAGATIKNEVAFIAQNLVPFAEQALRLSIEFYSNTAHLTEVIEAGIVTQIVKTLNVPLTLKYRCPSESSWKLSLNSLITVIRLTLTIAKDPKFAPHFNNLWPELADCMENFLFNKNEPPANLGFEERKREEFMDCQLIEVIRTDILPFAKALPISFVVRIMDLLNRGSIHDCDPKDSLNFDVNRRLRTDLSRTCFEALLDASRGEPDVVRCSSPNGGSAVGAAALDSLLRRCRQVIIAYPTDERRSAGTPLPRHRVAEMTQVLTAVGTLIESLHRQAADQAVSSGAVWTQLIELYPFLIEVVQCRQPEVQLSLSNTLKCYAVMLGPPRAV